MVISQIQRSQTVHSVWAEQSKDLTRSLDHSFPSDTECHCQCKGYSLLAGKGSSWVSITHCNFRNTFWGWVGSTLSQGSGFLFRSILKTKEDEWKEGKFIYTNLREIGSMKFLETDVVSTLALLTFITCSNSRKLRLRFQRGSLPLQGGVKRSVCFGGGLETAPTNRQQWGWKDKQ